MSECEHAEAGMCGLCARNLRAEFEKAEASLAAHKSHDRCNAGMRSRIKTLEEELAAMTKERNEASD